MIYAKSKKKPTNALLNYSYIGRIFNKNYIYLMKKITFLSVFLLLLAWGSYGQCFRTALYPFATVVSNNLGLPQVVTDGVYTSEYSQVSGLTVGNDYVFTCTLAAVNKYITVTDFTNAVIAYGPSPLTVEAITSAQVRLHYSDDAACAATSSSHTVTVMAILDCAPPINLQVAGITTTSAEFTWEPLGTETAWQVLVLPNGATAPTAATTGTDVTGGTPAYTDLTLSPATKYQFYVRASCGSEFSPWNGPLNLTSACVAIASFSENFDSIAYGQLPVCWSQVKNGTGSSQYSYARVTDYNFNSASRAAILYSENSGTAANLLLVAPEVSNLSAGTHRLKFFARSGSGTQNIQFGTVDNTTANAVFTEVDNINATNTYQEFAIDYTVYEGTDTFIAIRHNGAQYSSVFIDDIRWELAPSCADVSDITVPADGITASGATINWEPNGDETEWDVVYGLTTVTDPSTLTPITPAPTGTPEAVLTGLTDNTTYKVWIRSVCGEEQGVWVGPKTFKTNCIPVASINENFDTLAYGTLPGCWSVVKNGVGVSQYAYAQVTDYNFYSPSRVAQIYNDGSAQTGNVMLVSPALTNVSAGTHRIKFYARSGNPTGSLQVGTIDNTSVDGYFTSLETFPLTSTYAEFVLEFTDTSNPDSYIAFRHNNTGTYNSIFIDNVIWETIPQCADVTEVTVPEITTDSATINWAPGGNESEWDVVYGLSTVTDPSTLTPITPAPTVTTETTLTGLTDNTTYKVWVRSVCGNQDGAWIGPVSFTTPCLPVTAFDENFDTTASGALPGCWSAVKNGTGVSQYAYSRVVAYDFNSPSRAAILYNDNSSATSNVMLVSPNLSNLSAGTHRVKFFAKSGGTTGSVQVGTVDNTTADAFFTEMETVALTSTYTEYAVNFTESEDSYIAFRFNTTGSYTSIYIDDVRWEVAPLCADITGLAAVGTSTSTADITWNPGGSETNWQVAFGEATVTDPSLLTPSAIITDPNYTITTGLEDGTVYNVWVRSVCGSENGAWIGPKTFATACIAATIESTTLEGFESTTGNELPVCWNAEVLVGTNNWKSVTAPSGDINTSVSGPRIMYKDYNTSTAVLYSLPYNFSTVTAANPIRISTYLHRHLSANENDKYTVYVNTIPSLEGAEELLVQFSKITAEPVVAATGFYNSLIDIPESFYGQSQVYVIIEGYTGNGFSSYALGIDDFKVEYTADLANQNFDSSNFKFYPNPVKNTLNLSYVQNISNVSVFNLLGQKVLENTINATSTQVDMSGLASGSYLVKVTSDNQTKTIKVIKE